MKEKYKGTDVILKCIKCHAILTPNITFFGEKLSAAVFQHLEEDLAVCDLLLVIGTSLRVMPIAGIIESVKPNTPRCLINWDPIALAKDSKRMKGLCGFYFDDPQNHRDVFLRGNCDDICQELATALGWKAELDELIGRERSKADSTDSMVPISKEK